MPLPAHHTVYTRGQLPCDIRCGIRTHYLSSQAAVDLRLRPHNHRDQLRSPILNDRFVMIVVISFVRYEIFLAMIIHFVAGALSTDVLGEHTALIFKLEEHGIRVSETRLLL
jgi:hypothetical protein